MDLRTQSVKSSCIFTGLALAGLMVGSTEASADVLTSYDFVGGSAAQTSGVLTGSNVTTGTGPTIVAAGTGYAKESTSPTTASLALAIPAEDYIEFTVSTSSVQTATLTTFTFDWWLNSPNATGTQSYSVYALSDVNGFVDGQQFGSKTLGEGGTPGVGFNAHDAEGKALGLSFNIAALGPLTTNDSITFRIYFVDNRTGVSSPFHAVDNVTVNGTVTEVPEPGSLALLGLGGLMVARRRRSRS